MEENSDVKNTIFLQDGKTTAVIQLTLGQRVVFNVLYMPILKKKVIRFV